MQLLLLSGSHDYISQECKNLILRLVRNDPNQRPTAKEALQDPWFTMKSNLENSMDRSHNKSLSLALKKMKERSIIKSVMADNTLERISMMTMKGELLKRGIDMRRVTRARRASSDIFFPV